MSLWMVRVGKFGEYEKKFLDDHRIYLTWPELQDDDLSKAKDYKGIKDTLRARTPDAPERRLGNWSGQIWAFALSMKPGDVVVVPRKTQPAIAVGEIVSGYEYNPGADPEFRHSRKVKWLNTAVPRAAFGQDLLYSLGSIMTICAIARNDAEQRVRKMATNGWKDPGAATGLPAKPDGGGEPSDVADETINLETFARDQIQKVILQKYKGHGLAYLVGKILEAQGYVTFVSPPGADKGIDILAAPKPMGFGKPRICVQVKSGSDPIERTALDQLVGVMQNVNAEQGLLVSWGGFKSSIEKERASQFFRVRLWDADELLDELLAHYDDLPAEIRTELPLKKVWVPSYPDEQE
jgi:restriction system protein